MHVHVIVNRVHPEAGIAKTISNDRAEAYEKSRGYVFCEERVKNNEARSQGQWVTGESDNRRDHFAWKKEQSDKVWADYRADRDAAREDRKGEFDILWERRQERFAAKRAEIKQLYKLIWRDRFARERKELKAFDTSIRKRLHFALTQKKRGKAMAGLRAFTTDKGQRFEFMHAQKEARRVIAREQNRTIREAGREVSKVWAEEREQLYAQHRKQDAHRLDHYSSMSSRLWKSGNDNDAKAEFYGKASKDTPGPKRGELKKDAEKRKERNRNRPRKPRPR